MKCKIILVLSCFQHRIAVDLYVYEVPTEDGYSQFCSEDKMCFALEDSGTPVHSVCHLLCE
jgi:hypothetical protein